MDTDVQTVEAIDYTLTESQQAEVKKFTEQIVQGKALIADHVLAQQDVMQRLTQIASTYQARLKTFAASKGIDLDAPDCGKWEFDAAAMQFVRK